MGKYKHLDPKNLTVFITGATAGFGKATAARFLGSGARVIATGRRGERLKEMKQEMGARLHTIKADVGNTTMMKDAIESLPEEFKNVDILVSEYI